MSEQGDYLRTHRFAIDSRSSKLLQAERLALTQLQTEFPEVKGLAFYGSWVKASKRADSDLDMVLFYDGNEHDEHDEHDEHKDEDSFGKRFGHRAGELLEGAAGNVKLELYFIDISGEATDKALAELDGPYTAARSRYELMSRFFLGVGDGLYKHRTQLLDKLETLPNGEETFQKIMGALKDHSRRLTPRFSGPEEFHLREVRRDPPEIPYEGKYPKSIQAARKFFTTFFIAK